MNKDDLNNVLLALPISELIDVSIKYKDFNGKIRRIEFEED